VAKVPVVPYETNGRESGEVIYEGFLNAVLTGSID
jgi:hypothetical protein